VPDQSLGLLIALWLSFSVSGGAEWVNPTGFVTEGLQEAPAASAAQEAAASAATFLFLVISAAAGQAAHKGQALGHAAHGVLHLIEGSTAFAAASNNGQAFGHAAHGVRHLIDGSTAFAAHGVPDNGQAFGHAAHGVLHLIEGSPAASALLSFLSLLGFPWLLLFPPLGRRLR
jgi:hypothetical protein